MVAYELLRVARKEAGFFLVLHARMALAKEGVKLSLLVPLTCWRSSGKTIRTSEAERKKVSTRNDRFRMPLQPLHGNCEVTS